MTIDEATVAQKRHYPVIITYKSEELRAGEYYIREISEYYNSEFRKYKYSLVLDRNQRALFSLGIDDVSISPKYESVLEQAVITLRRQKLKNLIKEYINLGGNKTTITKLVKELIDEIKAHQVKNKGVLTI